MTTAPHTSHRAELPTVESGTGQRVLLVGGGIVSLGVGIGLAVALGQVGIGSLRMLVVLPFVPPGLYALWLRRWRERRVFFASTVLPLEASRGCLIVAGRAMRASSVDYARGVLRVNGPLGASHAAILATPAEARAIADTLAVREQGLRTVRVWGPLASIPVVGTVVTFAAPALAIFAGVVLLLATNLTVGASLAFSAIFAGTVMLSVLALARRTLHVADDHVELRWLGRARSIATVSIESIALTGGAIVLRVRGERALRLPLVPSSSETSFSMEEARVHAAARAEEPIALASVRSIARIFE